MKNSEELKIKRDKLNKIKFILSIICIVLFISLFFLYKCTVALVIIISIAFILIIINTSIGNKINQIDKDIEQINVIAKGIEDSK